jgi:tetratricopeptide (TPR) repeat protein
MINIRSELVNYPPIDLTKVLERNPELPDNIKNSIVLYNKALENLRMDSEDIAMIELKKAISMNPGFHEAINLLGICYCYINDQDKAAEMFERVVSLESNGVNAIRYLNNISPGRMTDSTAPGVKKEKEGLRKPQKGEKTRFSLIKTLANPGKDGIVKYLVGFFAGALVVFVFSLIFGPLGNQPQSAPEGTIAPATTAQSDNSSQKYAELNENYEKLKKDLDASKTELDYYRTAMKLFDIENLISAKKYEEAADTLVMLKTVGLNGAEKNRFNSLYAEVMPKAAKSAFDQGYKLYNSKQYSKALEELGKVEVYTGNYSKMDAALYYMGKCYVELKDSRNAVSAFQRVVNTYPKSTYARYAAAKIKELTEKP